jgi:segregation and condensation protein B
MNYRQMKSVIEGLLFAAGDEGLDVRQIADVLEENESLVYDLLQDLKNDFRREGRGIQIVEIAGTYQMTTLPEHAPFFERLAYSPSHATLSQAALETLAIIAYKQPITRVEIEEVRGVKSERPIQTLMAKQLIQEVARAEVVGRPILYGTTKQFLDYFGLKSLNDLPAPPDFDAETLAEQTRDLFDKLGDRQLTIDDLADLTDES